MGAPDRRILIITHALPLPDLDSASLRLVRLIGILQELGGSITLLATGRGFHAAYAERRDEAAAALERRGVAIAEPSSLDAYLADHGRQFDLILLGVVAGDPEFVPRLRWAAPQAAVVFDTIELTFVSMARAARLQRSQELARRARSVQAGQLRIAASADAVLVVTDDERRLLDRLCPGARVRVVSNIHAATSERLDPAGRRDLLFVGNFVHMPNRDAMRHFVGDLWPHLRRRLPGARLQIVGLPTPEIEALAAADVWVAGYLPDLSPTWRSSRLSIAPLRFGAGIKGKVLESMAQGLPVVMTPVAAEGIGAVHGLHALIAADAPAFLEDVERLYVDDALWLRLAEEGRRHVEEHFSAAAAKRSLEALLEELGR